MVGHTCSEPRLICGERYWQRRAHSHAYRIVRAWLRIVASVARFISVRSSLSAVEPGQSAHMSSQLI
jgi:hypothetical protein